MSKSKAKKQLQQAEQQFKLAEEKILESMNPTALKQEFYLHRTRVNDLIEEVNSLNISIAENNEKHLKQTYEFEQRLKQEEEERDSARQRYESLVQSTEEKWVSKKKLWELEKRKDDSKRARVVSELSDKVQTLSNRIEKIKEFRSKQDEYLQTISSLEQKLERADSNHKLELNRLEDEHAKIRQIHTKAKDDKIENIKEHQYRRVRRMIDDRDKSIFTENNLLKGQKILCEAEEDSLREQKERLKEEIREQERILKDLEVLNPQQENYERSLKIVNLQGRISELKRIQDDNRSKYAAMIDQEQKKHLARTKEIEKEIKSAHNSLRQKEKQVKDLKMYAQMVLDQRKPLEWYTLEVLSDNPKEEADRVVNLDNILRQLFIKINSGVPPKNWRNSLKESALRMEASKKLEAEQMSVEWPSQIGQSISSQLK